MPIAGILSGTRLLDASTPDAKLQTIASAGKVANSATTATASATVSAIVARDGAGRAQVADPAAAADIANKGYVDSVASGLDAKQSVRVISTSNITLSAPQTIDGVAVVAGERVLVAGQTAGAQNGIYVVAAAAWTRATDADNSPAGEVTGGMYAFVEEGTVNANTGWVLTTNNPITLNTTALVFTQFSTAGVLTNGNGLDKTGNVLSVRPDAGDASISVGAAGVRVAALGVTNAHIAAGAGIVDTKLATIASAGKVANTATTATAAATASAIIARDGAGRAQIATPSVAADIANKGYVDGAVGANGTIVDAEVPTGTINGINVTFTLAFTPIAGSVQLYVGGLRLLPTTHFTVSGATITMVADYQPITGEPFLASYRK